MPTRVPGYCLHRPSGRAYVRIAGRCHYLGAHGSPESLAAYGRMLAELAVAPAAPPSTAAEITVVELAAAYLDFAEGYYVKNGVPTPTIEQVKLAIRALTASYGRTTAVEFGPLGLLAIQKELATSHRSRSYVNATVATIKRIFKWATSRELVPGTVYQALATVEGLRKGRTTAREPEPILPVDDATLDATLPHLPQIVADMVQFQRLTGCRPGEVCALRPRDLDRSGEVWQYRPASHKTEHRGKARAIFIGPKAQAVLLPYLLRAADAYCFSPAESAAKQRDARSAARKTPLSCGNRPGTNRKAKPKRQPRNRYTREVKKVTATKYGQAGKSCAAISAYFIWIWWLAPFLPLCSPR